MLGKLIIALLIGSAHAQYYPTPAETLHAQRDGGFGVFAWDDEEQKTVWWALQALNGQAGIDDLLWGRALRIQEKMKTRDVVWVGAHGETWLPPVKLTLPEMILAGFALQRYCGHGSDTELPCDYMVDQIRHFNDATVIRRPGSQ